MALAVALAYYYLVLGSSTIHTIVQTRGEAQDINVHHQVLASECEAKIVGHRT